MKIAWVVGMVIASIVLWFTGCGPLHSYKFATYGPGDTSAGDLTHVSQPGARVVIPKNQSISAPLTQAPKINPEPVPAADSGCDESLWRHVYHRKRLVTHERCTSVTGVIIDATGGMVKDGCRHEADGDGHCFLKLDKGQEEYLNDFNKTNENGALVFELMCRYTVTQVDAKAVCKNWKQWLVLPPVGTHVRITGAFVTDTGHLHNELHPISRIEVLK